MFKFELDQVVYYIDGNQMCSAPILARMYSDAKFPGDRNLDPFGSSSIVENNTMYATCHGKYRENRLFASKEELAKHIVGSYDE